MLSAFKYLYITISILQIYIYDNEFVVFFQTSSCLSYRFLYALQYKNWDERTIETMSEEVASSRLRLEKEYERLAAFAKTFNKEFATDKNDCFDTALVMLRKLRSGISQTKKIFKRFCPRARKNEIFHAIGQKPASAYEYARISADV